MAPKVKSLGWPLAVYQGGKLRRMHFPQLLPRKSAHQSLLQPLPAGGDKRASPSPPVRERPKVVAIKKPEHVRTAKPKRLHPTPDAEMLLHAASAAVYGASRYHCRGQKGEPVIIRVKPSTPCPRQWSDQDATQALRDSIRNGNVCEIWEDGFPRHVWHRDGDVLYEARHTRGPTGLFHAYPIESLQAPIGLAP